MTMVANYTWSHAIDNLSSTFFETATSNQYGNTNITTNNGVFSRGLMDPYHPELDRGDAEFDLPHRVTLAATWRVPTGNRPGLYNAFLGGWSLNPLFVARSGQPFSVFDSTYQVLPYNTPRATFAGDVANTGNGLVATATPNTYQVPDLHGRADHSRAHVLGAGIELAGRDDGTRRVPFARMVESRPGRV